MHIPWGGAGAFMTPIVQGATAYSTGKAKTISGIKADDKTGKIVIHLTAPYGPFDNVLAFPALGLVPSSTPLAVQANNPPPGVGPYKVTNITPGQSYDVVKNPELDADSRHPLGSCQRHVKVSPNVNSNALSVLNNTADVFDWADTIPGSLLPQIKAKASDRFANVNLGGSTYYIFFNVTKPPFNNQLVREAVVTGLNQQAMNKLASGSLEPACFFLPPGVPGHPTGACPYGDPASGGNIAKAKQLIQQSGMAGTKVTVWSETRSPRQQWMTYYTSFLNQIGLKASIKVIADANYFTTIGSSKSVNPQTGFADWNQDFPNPIDFYLLVDGKAIHADRQRELRSDQRSEDQRRDPKLGTTPTTQLKQRRQGVAGDRRVRGQEGVPGRVRVPDVPVLHVRSHELHRCGQAADLRLGLHLVPAEVSDMIGRAGADSNAPALPFAFRYRVLRWLQPKPPARVSRTRSRRRSTTMARICRLASGRGGWPGAGCGATRSRCSSVSCSS